MERAEAQVDGPRPSLYFVKGPIDFALIGGVSVATYLVIFFGQKQLPSTLLITIAGYLVWICNWPHFAATSYRLYHSRENIRQYPMTALVVPWLVLAGVVGSLASPTLI